MMKNYVLKVAFALLIGCVASKATTAQFKRPHVLIGGNVSYNNPQGNFANLYKFGAGGEVFAGIGFSKTYLVGTLGIADFIGNNENSYGNLIYKPIKIGIRQFLFSNKIFLNADMGNAYIKDKTMSNSESKFTTGVGAGARLFGLEASLYYNSFKAAHQGGFSNAVQYKVGWSMTL